VYYISKGYLKEANKRYSGGIKNDYTLIFTNETKVVAADQLNNLANIENGVVNPFFGEHLLECPLLLTVYPKVCLLVFFLLLGRIVPICMLGLGFVASFAIILLIHHN